MNSGRYRFRLDGADNIIDIFQKICEAKIKGTTRKQARSERNPLAAQNLLPLLKHPTVDPDPVCISFSSFG